MATTQTKIHFHLSQEDQQRLEDLPWRLALEHWSTEGVPLLTIRRGESRHPVVFVERAGVRYAIKETTPHMAQREFRQLQEIERRGIAAISPSGTITVSRPPIPLGPALPGGPQQYLSGDTGYLITRLALRVVPHVFLYRLNLTRHTKQRLLSAVAVLMIELHEHGIYWGDPSLANILLRIDGRRILAIMADAETTELFQGPVGDGLREQDLAALSESLAWQAEDIRQARQLPEEEQPLDETDFQYFVRRYRWLRREHARFADSGFSFSTPAQIQHFLRAINRWGFSLGSMTGRALQEVTTIRSGWYQRRIHELLRISIPRIYARRFYNMILGHQAIMSQQEGREIAIEEAARHWYAAYHVPAIFLLRQVLTRGQDPLRAYFAVMAHKWTMSEKAGQEIPLDEAIVDWSMQRANTGKLGTVDPSLSVQEKSEFEPAIHALEPALLDQDKLDPLLSTGERQRIHLQPAMFEASTPEQKHSPDERVDSAPNDES